MQIKDTTEEKVKELAVRSIENESTFLVDIELKGSGRQPVAWVYVESDEGGVKLDECVEISRRLQVMLEAHEVLGGNFTLNVSSPGLDRPLKLSRQYKVNKGRNARVRFTEEDKEKSITGVIEQADDQGIEVNAGDKKVSLSYSQIIETKIQPVL